jgi:hypothetical protein
VRLVCWSLIRGPIPLELDVLHLKRFFLVAAIRSTA